MELTHQEFSVLWRRFGLGEKPLLLDVPERGSTIDERDAIHERTWRQLQRRGPPVLAELEELLRAVARPLLEVDMRMRAGPGPATRLLACAAGVTGVVATHTATSVGLDRVRADELGAALLDRLPDHRAAGGNVVTLPAALVDRTGGLSADGALASLRRAGVDRSDARRLADWLGSRMVRTSTIGAAARDRLGRRHRAPRVLAVLDAEAGRYLVQRDRLPDGSQIVLLTPGGRRRVQAEVAHLVMTAGDAVAQRTR